MVQPSREDEVSLAREILDRPPEDANDGEYTDEAWRCPCTSGPPRFAYSNPVRTPSSYTHPTGYRKATEFSKPSLTADHTAGRFACWPRVRGQTGSPYLTGDRRDRPFGSRVRRAIGLSLAVVGFFPDCFVWVN